MAKVYLAEDLQGSDLVAVKILYPQFSEDISFIQRFIREARLASTLTDPHIVRVLDYGADRDLHYLVMEYVEGQDLHEILEEKGPFDWKTALEIIDQVATALEHAHTHGVVHRDIKPQNMMLTDSGLLKVLDFGIARIPTLPSLTQSGFIGSPYYASPEQAMGEEVDIRSDIYSSGVVLYELLSGDIPFDAKSPWSIISQHITREPPAIEISNGEIPKNVQALLNQMLAKRAEERFQTPAMVRQAVAAVLAGQPVPDTTENLNSTVHLDKTPMVDSLHERATKAIETEEWARAVDLLSQAAQLEPHNAEITEKLAIVERKARLTSLYKTGKRAMDSGRWEEAINHFNVVVELEPDHKDIAQLLSEAHQALKKENTRQFIATRYSEGLAHFEAERWTDAVNAFQEVKQLVPHYERVNHYLAEAERLSNPTLPQRIQRMVATNLTSDSWRWGLVTAGIVVIIGMLFFTIGNNNQVSGNGDQKQRLKILYEEAQLALENGRQAEALAKLEQILNEDPDYADAAAIRRELVATPTPTVMAAAPAPDENPLAQKIEAAQEAVELATWTEAIDTLTTIRAEDAEYQRARVSSLFCDAYIGRGLDLLANITVQDNQEDIIRTALADFEAGVAECPRRVDLKDQAERANAYLEALNTPTDNYDALISTLNPIVAAAPNYAGGNAKEMLYQAYLNRGVVRQQSPATVAAALGDYEAALALNVDDPSQAQTRRAELLLTFSQQPLGSPPPPAAETPVGTVLATAQANATPASGITPRPTVEPVRIKYGKPVLMQPENDKLFAGEFSEVILEWEPVGELQADEYYDLTIMHIFGDEPNYSGSTRTRETSLKLNPDIGVGEAGGDRFYWWVTVRKDNTAPTPNSLDLPVSPQSDAGTFIWSP